MSPSFSVAVAVMLRVKFSSLFAGGVIFSSARSSWFKVQEPSALALPALRLAFSGTPVMVIVSVSEPSVSASPAWISREMAVSSSPAVPFTSSSGVSATPVTSTGRVIGAEARESPWASSAMAVMVSSKFSLESVGGRMERPAMSCWSMVQVPSLLTVPAERLAPSGTPSMSRERDSDPSRSESAASILRLIRESSSPCAGEAERIGASVTAVTVTGREVVVSAMSPPSASVARAVTLSLKSASESAAGVMVRPSRSAGLRVQEPSLFSVPAERLAPVGRSSMMMLRLSEPSVSVRRGLILSAMALSSAPVALSTVSSGLSASAATLITWLNVVVRLSPSASVLVALMVREKSASLSAGGVTVSPLYSAGVRV